MCYSYLYFVLALKTIDAQQLFRSVFLKSKKKLLTAQNGKNGVFDGPQLFISAFSKMQTKRTFVCLLFLKLNQSQNTKDQTVPTFRHLYFFVCVCKMDPTLFPPLDIFIFFVCVCKMDPTLFPPLDIYFFSFVFVRWIPLCSHV